MVKKSEKKSETKGEKYFYAIGRRKSSVAQVRIYSAESAGENDLTVNGRNLKDYFSTQELQNTFLEPLKETGLHGKFKVSVLTKGGGVNSQAEAVRLGISRALVKFDENLKSILKAQRFLTRDSRDSERKKPGLKKARRSPQWSKR